MKVEDVLVNLAEKRAADIVIRANYRCETCGYDMNPVGYEVLHDCDGEFSGINVIAWCGHKRHPEQKYFVYHEDLGLS